MDGRRSEKGFCGFIDVFFEVIWVTEHALHNVFAK